MSDDPRLDCPACYDIAHDELDEREACDEHGDAADEVPPLAKGGVIPGGLAWVGEHGPEPLILPPGRRVLP